MNTQGLWDKLDKAVDYVDANKDKILLGASVIFGVYKGTERLTRNIARTKKVKEDRYHRDYEVYDRSSGMYLQLRRPMTAAEQYEYSFRKKHGESPVEILSDMGLLGRRKGRRM